MSKKHSKKNRASFNYPDLKNSFNTLLANIRFASIDKPIKSIVVTSVGMDEGKSTVSSNLALAIANSGKSCLLIEGDMRKRSLAKMLQVHTKFGMYSLLTGRCKPNQAITETQFQNLYFLDCEPSIPNPSDILSTKRFASLLDFVYDKYDHIIIDTPPLVSFVDGALIGTLADATLLAVREGKAKKAAVRDSIEQLKQAKANILGTVLTFSTDTTESYFYYAYYNKEGKRVSKRSKNKSEDLAENITDTEARANLGTWFKGETFGKATNRQQSMVTNEVSEPDNTNPMKPVDQSDDNTDTQEVAKEYFQNAKHHIANTKE
ncbi:MAG: CpsD/CapB family tyrosine-protein kinase [Coriobacteriia bacterium]|nr:CpsD/CapB family tyrosine-protein kinase [Coriobacteriia bacterium]